MTDQIDSKLREIVEQAQRPSALDVAMDWVRQNSGRTWKRGGFVPDPDAAIRESLALFELICSGRVVVVHVADGSHQYVEHDGATLEALDAALRVALDEDADWDNVPPLLKDFVVSLLRKERASVSHSKVDGMVMAAVLTGSMSSNLGEMIAKVDGKATLVGDAAAAALGEMMSSTTAATQQVEDARIAAIDAAIARLSRPSAS
jgi:hypothetical protein